MTSGLSREQIGVTEAMVKTYGELIFNYSHNVQIRRGDPVRLKDFTAYEENRIGAGLADVEIAAKIGLSKQQVTVIRNIVERRKIRTDTYFRLNSLGGGKRFRPEATKTIRMGNSSLRESVAYDPERVRYFIEQGYWNNDTLNTWLEGHASERPNHEAIVGDGVILSYRELASRVKTVAKGLRTLGVEAGDVVAVQLPNIAEYLVAFLAITSIRGVMTTLYMAYGIKEIEILLTHSEAKAFVGLAAIGDFNPARGVLALCDTLPHLETVITVGATVDGCVAFESLDAPSTGRALDQPSVGADPFLLLYTSGTTASPKGVPLTYHPMLSGARLGVSEHGFTADDRLLSVAPFGHLFALYSVHLALAVGATMVLLPAFNPAALAQAIEAHRPTAIFAAPAHIAACLGTGQFDQHDVASLKLAILSGAQVSADIVRGLDAKMPNGTVTQLWGMTELQAGLYTRPGTPLETVARSAGRPSPGTEVRLLDDTGKTVPQGEEGELQIRGGSLFSGYFNNPDANAQAFTEDGWFRTGDLALLDDEGNVTLTGRSKDIINRGGVKYNPLDVECLLDKHPGVTQSAIVPIADPLLGERACAFIVPSGGMVPSLDVLCAYLLENGIAKVKLPERLEIIDQMPMTATRKIIKNQLKPRKSVTQ